jgi:hypothetical protein
MIGIMSYLKKAENSEENYSDKLLKEYGVFSRSEYENSPLRTKLANGTPYREEFQRILKRDNLTIDFSKQTRNTDDYGGLLDNKGKIVPDGNYIWINNTQDKFRFTPYKNQDGNRNMHAVISEGYSIYGAGESLIENGKIIMANTKTGHYVPIDFQSKLSKKNKKRILDEFNNQGKRVFESNAKKYGLNLEDICWNFNTY